MTPEEWWKNFALGMELDVAGTFIFNGIKRLDEVDNFYYPTDIFEIFYNLSVGVERLLKVAIILVEHDEQTDMEALEESLITHNVSELTNRLESSCKLGLASVHKELLSILSKFYKTYRYGRFSIASVPEIEREQEAFLRYISKYLKIELPSKDSFFPVFNSDKIRKFVGKVVHKISGSIFSVVNRKTSELNIYTDELRGDSKAIRIFYGDRLDFIDERIKKKEILLFLMNSNESEGHLQLVRSFEPLEFDLGMAPYYIKALINDSHLHLVGDEVDELYTEVEDVGERIQMVDIIDNEHLSYGE
ncbi:MULTISPECIES: hypothetical protein [Halomonadaceae]|uniref:Uncharacterized protein n=1 Tax=Vreelandella halophila TaxID=86177 RepID=A0A9X4YFE1_9GAMM|nr:MULTISPECIES: hypothetical protein [Halomonas]MYL28143.1 hypothetical protein [Halomonas utahensis]MYL75909.1 hypothetical protein [Halomonas sp. 22501_18_FS]